jgi:hypothetical protein
MTADFDGTDIYSAQDNIIIYKIWIYYYKIW